MKKINGMLALNAMLEGEVVYNGLKVPYKIKEDNFVVGEKEEPTTIVLTELLDPSALWYSEFLPIKQRDLLNDLPINIKEEYHNDKINLHYEVVSEYLFFCNGTDVTVTLEQVKAIARI